MAHERFQSLIEKKGMLGVRLFVGSANSKQVTPKAIAAYVRWMGVHTTNWLTFEGIYKGRASARACLNSMGATLLPPEGNTPGNRVSYLLGGFDTFDEYKNERWNLKEPEQRVRLTADLPLKEDHQGVKNWFKDCATRALIAMTMAHDDKDLNTLIAAYA